MKNRKKKGYIKAAQRAESRIYKTSVIENATIINTFLGTEDHGIFTFFINFQFESGSLQSIGGYCLESYENPLNMIKKILDTFDVKSWEDLKDKQVRVRSVGLAIVSIGHFEKDKWLDVDVWGVK